MKKLLAVILLAVPLVLNAGGKKETGLRIAFVPQVTGIPYFTAMEKGGLRAAAELGGKFLSIGGRPLVQCRSRCGLSKV